MKAKYIAEIIFYEAFIVIFYSFNDAAVCVYINVLCCWNQR